MNKATNIKIIYEFFFLQPQLFDASSLSYREQHFEYKKKNSYLRVLGEINFN